MDVSITEETPGEAVVALLRSHGLPTEDLNDQPHLRVFAIRHGRTLVGVVGIEILGAHGLLRSLAVCADARRRGLGHALVQHVEAIAGDAGVTNLFLLTESADAFFARHGYARTDRARVPPAIASTPEFVSLCPDTATCMHKTL